MDDQPAWSGDYHLIPSSPDSPQIASFGDSAIQKLKEIGYAKTLPDIVDSHGAAYFEAQIHQGVSIDDIDTITVTYKKGQLKKNKLSAKVEDWAKKNNVKIEYVEIR